MSTVAAPTPAYSTDARACMAASRPWPRSHHVSSAGTWRLPEGVCVSQSKGTRTPLAERQPPVSSGAHLAHQPPAVVILEPWDHDHAAYIRLAIVPMQAYNAKLPQQMLLTSSSPLPAPLAASGPPSSAARASGRGWPSTQRPPGRGAARTSRGAYLAFWPRVWHF